MQTDWYKLGVAACLDALRVDADGLDSEEVARRRARYGPNVLEAEAPPSAWRRFARQLNNVLTFVLLGATALTAGLGHWIDAAVIGAVVLINALVGFIQEGRAEEAMRDIQSMLRHSVVVLRNGQTMEIDAADLVPGDIMILQQGERVPADARLTESRQLTIDQSSLTGESVPTPKDSAALDFDAALPDRSNLVYAGTLVARGWARAVVTATGADTELGQVSGELRTVRPLRTPLLDRVGAFARRLSLLILILAGAIAVFGTLVHGHTIGDMLIAAVSIAVAAIPEGLTPVITITLAIGVRLMGKRNAVVRRLPAVETLGEVDVICTDKTGTLTANEMTVRSIITADARFETTGVGFRTPGDLIAHGPSPAPGSTVLEELLMAALNCNDARLEVREGGYEVNGDPTECALAVLAAKGGLDPADPTCALERLDVIPFDSEQRFMATLHPSGGDHNMVYVKGAPEIVIGMCAVEHTRSETRPLDRDHWLRVASEQAARGERVLALASTTQPPEDRTLSADRLEGNLALLGIVGTTDPPRPEVATALERCRSAGIQVKMITGDHADTACAIGRELGLCGDAEVLTGEDLDLLDDAAFVAAAEETSVFARTSPRHKLRLVIALQKSGHVVAMTGDGVNDAPALKRSDVGIAMGRKGTHAAREAAEVVLVDDNFATIVRAVEAGRNIDASIRKSVLFLLPTSVTEALVIALAIVAGYQLPMTPVQILWINMITAVTLGIALAFEPGGPEVMQQEPRGSRLPLLSRLVVWRTAFVSLLMLAGIAWLFSVESESASLEYARTAAVSLLVVFEALYLISSRHLDRTSLSIEGLFGNRVAVLAIAGVLLIQLLFVYTPPFHVLFSSAALSAETWSRIGCLGALLLAIVELEKLVRRGVGRGAGTAEST
ncbi:MAG: HAD-IC family P-type ATPase [Pseudomonadales bacterium]|jgi:magnesium-transporting ATPase (P-type)